MNDYKYIGNTLVYKSIKQLTGTIIVKVADKTRHTILCLEPKQTKKTFGIFVSMDGNSKDQMENLLKKSRQMAEYFRTSKVEKNET